MKTTPISARTLVKEMFLLSIAFILVWTALGFWLAPYFDPKRLSNLLTERLHRPVIVEALTIQPYAVAAGLSGFTMMEAYSSEVAATFKEIFVNLQTEPIFDHNSISGEIHAMGPYLHKVREFDIKGNLIEQIGEFLEPQDFIFHSYALFTGS